MALIAFASSPTRWPAAALTASLAMIGAAHAFEIFADLFPCPLCLRQREVYWAAAGLAAAGLLINWRWPFARLMPTLCLLLGIVFLAGAGVASYHAGVEWGLLPAPSTCAAGSSMDFSGGLSEALTKPTAIGDCTEPPVRVLGLSMAGWNALASLAFAAMSFLAASGTNFKKGQAA